MEFVEHSQNSEWISINIQSYFISQQNGERGYFPFKPNHIHVTSQTCSCFR